jgi:hypothetical protein
MVFVKISCPAWFDTDNYRTFSPELEVAEGAGSSPEARNLEARCSCTCWCTAWCRLCDASRLSMISCLGTCASCTSLLCLARYSCTCYRTLISQHSWCLWRSLLPLEVAEGAGRRWQLLCPLSCLARFALFAVLLMRKNSCLALVDYARYLVQQQ